MFDRKCIDHWLHDYNQNEGWRVHHGLLAEDAEVYGPLVEVECEPMRTPAIAAPVLAIGHRKGKKRKAPSKSHNGKSHDGSSSSGTKGGPAKPSTNPKEAKCFYCHEKGHWK